MCQGVQSLLLLGEDGKDATCVRCEQVDELLSLVAELREEVPLCHRFEALTLEGEVAEDEVEGLPPSFSKERRSSPRLKTASSSGRRAGDDRVESLRVKIRGRADKADILVGVCYRPPNQDEEKDEEFYKQLVEAARLPALVLMGDFGFPDICWEYNTVQKKQSRRFLECMEDSFLMQLVRELMRSCPARPAVDKQRRSGQTSYPQGTPLSDLVVSAGVQTEPPPIQEDAIRDLLLQMDCHESMGPDGFTQRAEGTGGEGSLGGFRELQGCQPDLGAGKVMERIVLKEITWQVWDNPGIRPSQHGLRKSRSCLTNLISFYDLLTRLVDEGKAVDVVCLGFSKAFDAVSHLILLQKLAARGLDRCTLGWKSPPFLEEAQALVKLKALLQLSFQRIPAMESQEKRAEDLEKANLAKQQLAELFQSEGLDEEYWLIVLLKVLGVKSKEALKHLQYEDYLKLESAVRYPWEKTALRKLLQITDNKETLEQLQKQCLEMMKQRQEEAKLALQKLKEMHHSLSQSNEILRQKEEALWQAMDISRKYWPLPEKALADVLASTQKQLEQQEMSLGRSENVSDKDVLRRASGGLALQGIYQTNSLEDVLAKREQLIRVPAGFRLAGPEQGSLLERKEFSSSAAEANFTNQCEIESDKSAIRRKQLDKALPLNHLMKSVLGFLLSQPVNTKKYFLQWMKIFMDDLSSDRLDELKREYHQLWSQILAIKKSIEGNNSKTLMMKKLDSLSSEINDSSIGLEHILREVGQIYEALESTDSKDERLQKLPEIAADLMVSGYPIELMDGDASYVPLQWVAAIFDRLIEKLGDTRVFVLSVLGIQSTGKSTLLNAMFGLQFSVSAGRCTRGAFMQLIKADEELQRDVNFDYMLVVDTEGLRAIEMANKHSLNHDNELATFVIGIGNMTLINIFGENPSEMQDILQIAVQAFLRMKQVKLSPGCLFVHQNVGEITAKEQNMEGQRRLQEKLDEMTVTAAQQEFCDITCFSDVIRFDVNTHIHYFAHLWEGNPPMAPPNPTYSQNVQELKSKILLAARKESPGSVLRLSSLKVRICDLWNALRNENFIFSFKNSVEIAAYKKLETSFSQWTWKLRRRILDLQMQLDNKVRNGKLEKITTKELEKQVQETSDAITKEMGKFFSEDRDCEILIQWKTNTELKLKDLQASLLDETRRKCEKLLELKKNQSRLDERKSEYENELLKKSRELALSVKGQGLSEQELRRNFDSLWLTWVTEVSSNAPPLEEVNIDAEIESVLLEHFKEPKIDERIGKFSKQATFSLDEKKHVSKKKIWYKFWSHLSESDLSTLQLITDRIIRRVKENIDQKEKDKMDYSHTFIHEILKEVQEGTGTVPSTEKYTFTKDYSIDLSVYLCKTAAARFKDMHAAFRKANDPVIYLESKREDFFTCFQISCQGATSITTFADFLCSKIAPGLRLAVYDKTALVIAERMRSEIPDFNGSRANLEVCILKYLAQEEKFEKFKLYLTSPVDFLETYIQTHVETYCSDQNSRLVMFLDTTLAQYYEAILKAVVASTTFVKDRRDSNKRISLWLDEFCRELGGVLRLPRSDLVGIEHLEITDIEFLNNAMTEALSPLRDLLKEEFARADLSSFEKQPHKTLLEQFPGCKEQCPFCKAVCTNTIPNHDGDHQLVFHRPKVLGRYKWYKTDNLVIDICSSSVVSECSFRIGEDTWIPYKKYRTAGHPYSTWNILPDTSVQKYWKWFVSYFRAQLEEFYEGKFQGRGEIPDSWRTVTKQEALDELR
ncbi:interferon-induced very large GTPase 1-like [Tympanuchus pallidicinctus]|uniref:interferon-induced very large GTPase 1-like n=1 Tax=Tympanuchus pallidicinctus TaxID=109042 RepID=UPI002286CFA9|nr:interferon-induced very large GTPase 1-like [Tympanuchus pallidicinctus]